MQHRIPLLASSALALSACNSSPGETADQAPAQTPSKGSASAVAGQQFVDTVSASDLYETEAGELAKANGGSRAVKDFGAMMVKDHAGSTASLKTAVAANPDLMLTPQLTSEQQAKLFHRFQRVAGQGPGGHEGIGLGLYITRALVEAHGGTLNLQSTPGQLTTFCVRLPLVPPQDGAAEPRAPAL